MSAKLFLDSRMCTVAFLHVCMCHGRGERSVLCVADCSRFFKEERTEVSAAKAALHSKVCAQQGCLYGGSSEDGPRDDAWLFDAATLAWEQTARSRFGDFTGAAKAWQAAAVLEGLEARKQ